MPAALHNDTGVPDAVPSDDQTGSRRGGGRSRTCSPFKSSGRRTAAAFIVSASGPSSACAVAWADGARAAADPPSLWTAASCNLRVAAFCRRASSAASGRLQGFSASTAACNAPRSMRGGAVGTAGRSRGSAKNEPGGSSAGRSPARSSSSAIQPSPFKSTAAARRSQRSWRAASIAFRAAPESSP